MFINAGELKNILSQCKDSDKVYIEYNGSDINLECGDTFEILRNNYEYDERSVRLIFK